MSIIVTELAIKEIEKVMEEQGFSKETHVLETGATGGGCSGFQYKLGFKEVKDVDKLNETVIEQHGMKVVISNRSLTYMDGTIINFHSGLDKRGFTFTNPLATKGCGCGQSFGV